MEHRCLTEGKLLYGWEKGSKARKTYLTIRGGLAVHHYNPKTDKLIFIPVIERTLGEATFCNATCLDVLVNFKIKQWEEEEYSVE